MAPTQATQNGVEIKVGRSVSLEHAASLLGVSRRTIYNRIRDGRLLTVRTLGGSQRVLSASMASLSHRTGEPRPGACEPAPATERRDEGHP
jgi:excisionase family DNA binding protein